MSPGVSPIFGAPAAVAARPALQGQTTRTGAPKFAPETPSGVGSKPAASSPTASGALRLPEEQAFKVSTINERLASLAAQAEPDRSKIDLKI